MDDLKVIVFISFPNAYISFFDNNSVIIRIADCHFWWIVHYVIGWCMYVQFILCFTIYMYSVNWHKLIEQNASMVQSITLIFLFYTIALYYISLYRDYIYFFMCVVKFVIFRVCVQSSTNIYRLNVYKMFTS